MSAAAHNIPSAAARTLMFSGLGVSLFGAYYVYDSIGPIAELLSRELGFTDTQIGTLNAIYSLPNIMLALVGGVFVDRFGARAVALGTAAICLAGAGLEHRGDRYTTHYRQPAT